MKRRIAVRAIIEKDGKLLNVKLKPYEKAIEEEYWCTLGGRIDDGESLEKAVIREVLEETGIVPIVGQLLYVQQFSMDDVESIEFFFHVTNAEDFTDIDLVKTTHGEKEIAKIAFIDPSKENVLPVFLKNIDCTDIIGKPTQFYNYL